METARGFDEAVRIARRQAQDEAFDLLLLDIDLGEEGTPEAPRDGTHLLQTLRQDAGCAGVPAVALTAYAMPGDEEQLLHAGFDGYLAKPFTRAELAQAVEGVAL